MRQFVDPSSLQAAVTDPYIRLEVDPGRPLVGYQRGDAVVWSTRSAYRGIRWLHALGPDRAAADLAAEAHEWLDEPPYGLTVAAGALPLIPEQLRPVAAELWDWWWIDRPPARQPDEDRVDWIEESRALSEFLSMASPRRSANPGDSRVRRWAGIVHQERLVAVAAETQHIDGVPHLAAIAVDPALRGRGLGGAVTAGITRRLFDEGHSAVTLGMYADNEPARRVYRRLGFEDRHHFASGRTPYGDVHAASPA